VVVVGFSNGLLSGVGGSPLNGAKWNGMAWMFFANLAKRENLPVDTQTTHTSHVHTHTHAQTHPAGLLSP